MDADAASDVSVRQSVYTGILPFQAIREMVDGGEIRATEIFGAIESDQFQPASIDLRLGPYAYPVDTSFLPGRGVKVVEKMEDLDPDFQRFRIDLRNGAVLEKGRVYVVPLAELPLDIRIREQADGGRPTVVAEPDSNLGRVYIDLARRTAARLARTALEPAAALPTITMEDT